MSHVLIVSLISVSCELVYMFPPWKVCVYMQVAALVYFHPQD